MRSKSLGKRIRVLSWLFFLSSCLKSSLLFLLIFCICKPSFSQGDDNSSSSIGVIYPDNKGPYRAILAEVISGIEEKSKRTVYKYPLSANSNAREISDQMTQRNTGAVIVLGREGLSFLPNLKRSLPVIVGGVYSILESEQRAVVGGVSLIPDPKLFFLNLKTLVPKIRKVVVIYNAKHNEWLMKLAREAASTQGLMLTALEAHDLPTAARTYAATLQEINPQQDALWLLQDSTTLEDTIFSLILGESWNRNLTVFSSNLTHVKKGLLFALYPNNTRMGNTLAKLASDALSGNSIAPAFFPLQDVDSAINMRTAIHSGIDVKPTHHFDTIFSEH
ncbi:MAG: ABC transporter substrate binding protein [Pseudomonadota bacterium]